MAYAVVGAVNVGSAQDETPHAKHFKLRDAQPGDRVVATGTVVQGTWNSDGCRAVVWDGTEALYGDDAQQRIGLVLGAADVLLESDFNADSGPCAPDLVPGMLIKKGSALYLVGNDGTIRLHSFENGKLFLVEWDDRCDYSWNELWPTLGRAEIVFDPREIR